MLVPHPRGACTLGRPKTYDRTEILARATALFWLHGYEGLSTARLAQELGLNRGTLYTEFGTKEALYAACLEHYLAAEVPRFVGELLDPEGGLEAIAQVLERFGAAAGQPGTERGCMACNAATESAWQDAAVRARVDRYVELLGGGFRRCLANAVADGVLPGSLDLDAWAARLTTTLLGIFVLIRSGLDGSTARQAAGLTLRELRALRQS